MITYKHAGARTTYSNSGALIAGGSVVVLRSGAAGKIGIAVADIPATTGTGELEVGPGRVHTLAKKVGDAFTHGAVAYWDSTNHWLTTTNTTTFTRAGTADQAAASAATTLAIAINT